MVDDPLRHLNSTVCLSAVVLLLHVLSCVATSGASDRVEWDSTGSPWAEVSHLIRDRNPLRAAERIRFLIVAGKVAETDTLGLVEVPKRAKYLVASHAGAFQFEQGIAVPGSDGVGTYFIKMGDSYTLGDILGFLERGVSLFPLARQDFVARGETVAILEQAQTSSVLLVAPVEAAHRTGQAPEQTGAVLLTLKSLFDDREFIEQELGSFGIHQFSYNPRLRRSSFAVNASSFVSIASLWWVEYVACQTRFGERHER